MRDDPVQIRDWDLCVHRLAILDEVRYSRQVQRVVFAAPPGPRDGPQAFHTAAREFAYAAGPYPVVSEERERVPQPLRERRQRRISGR